MTEIYKTTCNVCNLVYIGKHKIYNKTPNNYIGSGKKFKQHIKEHSRKNFTKQVILYCEDKNVRYYEEKLIELYNATNIEIGLNISKKSKGMHEFTNEHIQKLSGKNNHMFGKHHTKETLLKISNALKGENHPMFGKHHTKETKKKMKKNHANVLGKNNPFYSKKHSKETIQKNKEAHLGKRTKSINVYTKIGKYIKTFESIKQASEKLMISSAHICNALKGRSKFAGGYMWRYSNG